MSNASITTLLGKVKANLILEHSADDELLGLYITAATRYAESYQHLAENFYDTHPMPTTTEQAVIMLSSHSTNRGRKHGRLFLG